MRINNTLKHSRESWWLLVDPVLLLSAAAITALGAVLVYSATRGVADGFAAADRSFLQRQIAAAAVGLMLGVIVAFIRPRYMQQSWPVLYVTALLALLAVAVFGVEVSGTQGWFALGSLRLQPSEPVKLVLIVGLALILSPSRMFPSQRGAVTVTRMLAATLTACFPVVLVMLQPDLGTVLVYLVVTFVMVVVSGVSARWMLCLACFALIAVVGVYQSDILADFQKARLTVFINPNETGQVSSYAYNVEQAQIAIGNGGLRGRGLFKGTQTRSDLVPAQQTDFIFTVVGEEMGLRGAGLLLGLYTLMLFRIWRTALLARSVFGRLVCVGVFTMFMSQMFQTVGMAMGMMPVTGIPMPLVSYGGSSMITSMTALGLVAGVYRRRLDTIDDI